MIEIELAKLVIQLEQAFDWMEHTNCYVGINQDTTARKEGQMDNVSLMYIHENGSPANNIPPRPVFKLALSDSQTQDMIKEQLNESIRSAVRGNLGAAQTLLGKAGQVAQNQVKAKFGSGQLAPNSPVTIARKGSSAPLIDTGALRNSVHWWIEKE